MVADRPYVQRTGRSLREAEETRFSVACAGAAKGRRSQGRFPMFFGDACSPGQERRSHPVVKLCRVWEASIWGCGMGVQAYREGGVRCGDDLYMSVGHSGSIVMRGTRVDVGRFLAPASGFCAAM